MRLISSWEECIEHLEQVQKETGINFSHLLNRVRRRIRVLCSQCYEVLPERHLHGVDINSRTNSVPGFCSEGCAIKYAVEHEQLQGVTE